MTIKSCLDFEWNADALVKCDADLVRCRILTRLPDLSLNSRIESQDSEDWGEIASTEWEKIRETVVFKSHSRLILKEL